MNQQLVQSIAQIVRAMTAEEKALFIHFVNETPPVESSVSNGQSMSNGKGNPEAPPMSRDEKVAQFAQQIQDFKAQIAQITQQMQALEENTAAPLSPLPDDQWNV